MSKSLVLATALVALTLGPAGANPLGSLGELNRQQHVNRGDHATNCDALRRSADLRSRLRASERRELIARCERAKPVELAQGETRPVERD